MKTIIFLNNKGGVGKTASVTTIAHMLAEEFHKKVLLVDLDPQMNASCLYSEIDFVNLFSRIHSGEDVAPDTYSIEDLLLDPELDIHKCIRKTDYENLDIIFGGSPAPDPTSLLGDEIFGAFMKEIRGYYDYIICDTPPVANIIDAVLVAKYCDGAIFVVEQGAVSYRVAQKAMNRLRRAGCRILGTVLNKADQTQDKYYKKYGQYYRKSENDQG